MFLNIINLINSNSLFIVNTGHCLSDQFVIYKFTLTLVGYKRKSFEYLINRR